MHSSELRGDGFRIERGGVVVGHAEMFASFRETDRLGGVMSGPLDGLGATTLIMAHVAAFYDRYRERGGEFFAYADFFTFQRGGVCADYGMCDIWPAHKQVLVPDDGQGTVEAVTDRGVNVLLVPDGRVRAEAIEPVDMESARRNVRCCYVYSETGVTAEADLVIECDRDPLEKYAMSVVDTLPNDEAQGAARARWAAGMKGDVIRQTFRAVTLDEALARV